MSASPSKWKQRSPYRHERSDGAVVKYDSTTLCSTSKPWLAGHRGYVAFGPGAGDFSCLSYRKRGGRFRIPIKFKSAKSAMRAVDKRFPLTPQPMKDKNETSV